jgi:thiamine biosynthesis lipoprotein
VSRRPAAAAEEAGSEKAKQRSEEAAAHPEDVGRASFRAFGTPAEVLVTRPAARALALELVLSEVERVDRAASRFRPDSELMGICRAAGRPVQVGDELWELLEAALRAARLSDGAVDPTVGAALCRAGYDRDFALLGGDRPAPPLAPEAVPGWEAVEMDGRDRAVRVPKGTLLDLGATAKAMTADRAAAAVADRFSCGALVCLGGDLAVAGPAPAGGWRVGVQTPNEHEGSERLTVAVTAGGLATSGTDARSWRQGGQLRHHLIDPETGLPASSCWRAATVAAGSCLDANIASTAAIIKGADAFAFLAQARLPARLVPASGPVNVVGGWPQDDEEP